MRNQNDLLHESVDPAAFKEALRAIVGSVSIVATGLGTDRRGLTVTAASSLCADLTRVLICVNRNAEAHDVILKTGAFSWNILSTGDVNFAQRFAAMDGSKGAPRFAPEAWGELATGVRIIHASLFVGGKHDVARRQIN